MNEKENNVPVADTTSSQQVVLRNRGEENRASHDGYFKEQSERIQEAFNGRNNQDHRYYLLNQSKGMKKLLTTLELPWEKYIPLLHFAFVLYLHRIESQEKRNKAAKLTTELMSCITSLMQSGRLITSMADFYDRQIKEIECLITDGAINSNATENND